MRYNKINYVDIESKLLIDNFDYNTNYLYIPTGLQISIWNRSGGQV